MLILPGVMMGSLAIACLLNLNSSSKEVDDYLL